MNAEEEEAEGGGGGGSVGEITALLLGKETKKGLGGSSVSSEWLQYRRTSKSVAEVPLQILADVFYFFIFFIYRHLETSSCI